MAGRSEPFRAPGRFGSGCPKVAPARCSKPPSGRAPPLNQDPTDTRPLGPPVCWPDRPRRPGASADGDTIISTTSLGTSGRPGDGANGSWLRSSERVDPVWRHLGAVSGERHGLQQSRRRRHAAASHGPPTWPAVAGGVDGLLMAFVWVATWVTASAAISAPTS
jgi:hypothetical protein